MESGAQDDGSDRRRTPAGTIVVGRCRFILLNTLSYRVLLESHPNRHIRFDFMPTRIWSAVAVAGFVRGRNRGYRGCARRAEP